MGNHKRLVVMVSLLILAAFTLAACGGSSQCQAGDGKTVTTSSGLKYEELQVCGGTVATEGKKVTVNYTAYVKDGVQQQQFQQVRGATFQQGTGQVVRGLELGVLGMKVGGKRRLTLTPDLGYGRAGDTSQHVPGNATLIYEVELVSVAQ